MATPARFGRLWSTLAGGFLKGHRSVGGTLVKCEDLRRDLSLWEGLGEYLDLDLSRAGQVGNIRGLIAPPKPRAPRAEARLLERAVASEAARLGYAPEVES